MIKNVVDLTNRVEVLVISVIIGMGIRRTISMSKTMKMMASRKNRIENGIRALWLGSNPHSNGDSFSRDEYMDRDDKIQAKR